MATQQVMVVVPVMLTVTLAAGPEATVNALMWSCALVEAGLREYEVDADGTIEDSHTSAIRARLDKVGPAAGYPLLAEEAPAVRRDTAHGPTREDQLGG